MIIEDLFKKHNQEYLKNKIQEVAQFKRNLELSGKYSDYFQASLIEPQSNNPHFNPETKFPIVTNITDYASQNNGYANLDFLSRKGSGWNYTDKKVLNNGDTLVNNGQSFQVEVATFRNINQRVMILKNTKTEQLVEIDLKDYDNLTKLYHSIDNKPTLKKKIKP